MGTTFRYCERIETRYSSLGVISIRRIHSTGRRALIIIAQPTRTLYIMGKVRPDGMLISRRHLLAGEVANVYIEGRGKNDRTIAVPIDPAALNDPQRTTHIIQN